MRVVLGIFMFLHGWVHAIYAGHCWGLFSLVEGLEWPEKSWLLAGMMKKQWIRRLAGWGLLTAGLGLTASGVGQFFQTSWGSGVGILFASCSAVLYLVLWDGKRRQLDHQGGIGLALDLGLIIFLSGLG